MAGNDIKSENDNEENYLLKKFILFLDHYSDFHCLMRSLCYVFRVIKSCLIKNVKERKNFFKLSVSPLTVQECIDAENYAIRLVQQDYCGKLYFYIKSLNGNICHKVSKDLKIAFRPLKTLSVFCDSNGLLHSHSRIINANKPFGTRFPIILPKHHNFM